jgi:hypothetical protein
MGNGGSLPGGENDRGVKLITPPSSAEVKNTWSYTSTQFTSLEQTQHIALCRLRCVQVRGASLGSPDLLRSLPHYRRLYANASRRWEGNCNRRTAARNPQSRRITANRYCDSTSLQDVPKLTPSQPSYKWQSDKICTCAGLRAGWSGVRVPAGAGNFFLHHRVQTDSRAHPASYTLVTRGSFPGLKRPAREASTYCQGQEYVELYLHSPNTPS